jgi:SAM-dependent methyltransferase
MNLSDSWSTPSTVRGFATGPPNQTLMQFARTELARGGGRRAVDLGCGAGRNSVPLAELGWHVLGLDLSLPMVMAGAARAQAAHVERSCEFVLAPMDRLPVLSASCDLLIAHGIWNLASSGVEFRNALCEAARIARPGAALFVFTFSRNTLDDSARPVDGESFVFTQFANEPQVFLTRAQLLDELASAGFTPDPAVPLRELNRRTPGMLAAGGAPVIWEGTFGFTGSGGS